MTRARFGVRFGDTAMRERGNVAATALSADPKEFIMGKGNKTPKKNVKKPKQDKAPKK